jgi:hypothetical protein
MQRPIIHATEVVDSTNHAEGTNPYYQTATK